jgi:PqqD family protein of HPr-rel-A system
VTIKPRIGYAEHGDRAVLFNPRNDHYYGIDEVGIRVWKMLTAGASTATICSALAREYGVSANEVAQDVQMFLEQLRKTGLIL